MTWNFRVISHPDGHGKGGRVYQVHEVFYDESGGICGWSGSPATLVGDTPEELDDVARMIQEVAMMATLKNPGPGKEILLVEDLTDDMKAARKARGKGEG